MNGFGTALRLTMFGSSHGPNVGGEITGVPAGLPIDLDALQLDLDRRRPLGRSLASRRQEADRLVLESGVAHGRTTGGPIRGHVANEDARRAPYEKLRYTPRPGHADFPARVRYGDAADLSGGGIFSGRMTVGIVLAGGIARQLWATKGVRVVAFARSIGPITAEAPDASGPEELATRRDAHEVGAPDPESAEAMARSIEAARREGDSVGGVVEARAFGLPVGLGEPFFDSIESEVAHLLFAIPAVKGVEFGDGFRSATLRGSQHNDPYDWRDGHPVPRTNHAGGALGGLATGAPVVVRAAVKPTASIARPQETVDIRSGASARIVVEGRHDPCIVPRAIVVVEAALAFALADLGLRGGYLP